jgi:hypothetical protein
MRRFAHRTFSVPKVAGFVVWLFDREGDFFFQFDRPFLISSAPPRNLKSRLIRLSRAKLQYKSALRFIFKVRVYGILFKKTHGAKQFDKRPCRGLHVNIPYRAPRSPASPVCLPRTRLYFFIIYYLI